MLLDMSVDEFFNHLEAITFYEDLEYAEYKDNELQRLKPST